MITTSPATLEDINQLAALETQLFECDRISCRQFAYLMQKANGMVIKAELFGRLAGYAVFLKRKNSHGLRIYSIAVCPESRRRGVARAMLGYAEELAAAHGCTRMQLEVDVANINALQLYLTSGYCLCGKKEKYYENGSDALLLRKPLTVHFDDTSRYGSQIH